MLYAYDSIVVRKSSIADAENPAEEVIFEDAIFEDAILEDAIFEDAILKEVILEEVILMERDYENGV